MRSHTKQKDLLLGQIASCRTLIQKLNSRVSIQADFSVDFPRFTIVSVTAAVYSHDIYQQQARG